MKYKIPIILNFNNPTKIATVICVSTISFKGWLTQRIYVDTYGHNWSTAIDRNFASVQELKKSNREAGEGLGEHNGSVCWPPYNLRIYICERGLENWANDTIAIQGWKFRVNLREPKLLSCPGDSFAWPSRGIFHRYQKSSFIELSLASVNLLSRAEGKRWSTCQ